MMRHGRAVLVMAVHTQVPDQDDALVYILVDVVDRGLEGQRELGLGLDHDVRRLPVGQRLVEQADDLVLRHVSGDADDAVVGAEERRRGTSTRSSRVIALTVSSVRATPSDGRRRRSC